MIDDIAAGSLSRPPPSAVALLRGNRPFRALWCARSLSFVGDSVGLVALLLYVAGSTGSGLAVALLLLAGDVAPNLLSPLTGALSDRFDRARLMIGSELAQGAVVLVIALTEPPLPLLLALVAGRATLARVFDPASRGAVPALVADDRLESANAALGLGTHGFDLLGPLLAALLLPVLGVRGLLLADAATFVGSALLLRRLPPLPAASPVGEGGEHDGFLRDAAAGVRYILAQRTLRTVVAGFCAVVAFSAADDLALVFLARGPLNGGEAAASLLYAGAGLGLLVGFAVLARFGAKAPALALLLVGFGVGSGGNLLTGLAWSVPAAITMQAVRGAGLSLIDVGANTFVQRLVPPAKQGRVFGNLYGAVGLAAGLSYLGGGYLLDAAGPRAVLVVAGLGGLGATAAAWRALRAVPQAADGNVSQPE